MSPGSRTSRTLVLIGPVLVAVGALAIGFFVGKTDAPTVGGAKDLEQRAFRGSFESSFWATKVLAAKNGRREGRRQGKGAGTSKGRARGTSSGQAAAQAQLAAIAAEQERQAEAEAAAAAAANLPPGYFPYPSTSPAPSGSGVDPGCYPVDGVPCD